MFIAMFVYDILFEYKLPLPITINQGRNYVELGVCHPPPLSSIKICQHFVELKFLKVGKIININNNEESGTIYNY